MTLKDDGRSRKSKASKNKHKIKRVKCKCGETTQYTEDDIIRINGNKISYVTCEFCGNEIIVK